jgi:hypothetical protein
MLIVACEEKLYPVAVVPMYHANRSITAGLRVLTACVLKILLFFYVTPYRLVLITRVGCGYSSYWDFRAIHTLCLLLTFNPILYTSKPIPYLSFDWLLKKFHMAFDS